LVVGVVNCYTWGKKVIKSTLTGRSEETHVTAADVELVITVG